MIRFSRSPFLTCTWSEIQPVTLLLRDSERQWERQQPHGTALGTARPPTASPSHSSSPTPEIQPEPPPPRNPGTSGTTSARGHTGAGGVPVPCVYWDPSVPQLTEGAAPLQNRHNPCFWSPSTRAGVTEVSPMQTSPAVPAPRWPQDNRNQFPFCSSAVSWQWLPETAAPTFGNLQKEIWDVSITQEYKWDGRTARRQDKYREWPRTPAGSVLSLH